MSASVGEVQEIVDQLLAIMQMRIGSGQVVIHFHEYQVTRIEANRVFRPKREEPCRKVS